MGTGLEQHTHTQVARDNGGELAERVETRCEQLGVLPRDRGEGVCPLEAGHGQVNSVLPREVEGGVLRTGARGAWGYEGPGSSCRGENPQGECARVCGEECGPGVCGVAVRVHQCV